MILTQAARVASAALVALLLAAGCAAPLSSEQKEDILQQADADLLAGRIDAAERGFSRVLDSDPNDARASAGAGLARMRDGRSAEALEAFDAALREAPDDPHYLFLRARALASLGRLDEAIEATDRTLARDPANAAAVIMLMNLLVDADRAEPAIDVAREAARQWPADAGVLLKAGQVLVSTGAPLEALACFETARRLRPWDPDPLEGSVESLRRAGRTEEARALIPRLRELAEKTFRLEGLRRDAANAEATPGPSRAYIEELHAQGRFEDAVRETRVFLAQFPDASLEGTIEGPGGIVRPGLLMQAAEAAARAGDADASREFMGLAAAAGVASQADDLALGRAHAALGDHPSAAEVFAQCLERSPDDVDAMLGLGRARLALGQVDAARALIDRALATDPSRATGHALLGLLLIERGDRKGAEASLRRALARDADDPDALRGMGLLEERARAEG